MRHHGERVQCRSTFHDLTTVAFQPLLTCSDPFVLGALAINLSNSKSAGMVCLGHSAVVEGSAIVYAVLWWQCVCLRSNAVLF
jgi:hypothetical protein